MKWREKKAARNRCNMIHYLIFKAISFSDTTHCRIMHTKILQSRQSLAIFCTNTMAFCWLSEKRDRMDFWCQHFQFERFIFKAKKANRFKIRNKSQSDMHIAHIEIKNLSRFHMWSEWMISFNHLKLFAFNMI